jgi:hypothetical protein
MIELGWELLDCLFSEGPARHANYRGTYTRPRYSVSLRWTPGFSGRQTLFTSRIKKDLSLVTKCFNLFYNSPFQCILLGCEPLIGGHTD